MTIAGLLEEARNSANLLQHWKIVEGEKRLCLRPPESVCGAVQSSGSTLVDGLAATRKHVEEALQRAPAVSGGSSDSSVAPRVAALEKENGEMKAKFEELRQVVDQLSAELRRMKGAGDTATAQQSQTAPKVIAQTSWTLEVTDTLEMPANDQEEPDEEEEDDIDLFGSDDEEEDAEKERIKEERLQAYAAKKDKKPGAIAKSSVVFDVKPWADDTDMKELETHVRAIEQDGLVWGAGKLAPVAYGVMKLQIMCTVEDEKVSIEDLSDKIESFEDYVQSVDIAAFNKI